ncbi:MAG: hypothetical protein V1917_03410 [Candidatus Gottesmanbacteria bacterium]
MPDPGLAELPLRKLELPQFQQAKIRIEKSARIKNDLLPTHSSPNGQRLAEVGNVEKKSVGLKEGDKSGLSEIAIDIRGYQEQRFKMNYVSPDGKNITESLVFFVKTSQAGQPEWLTVGGQPLALNADLYDSRQPSNIHGQQKDCARTFIPRVDGRGAYTGIVSLFEQPRNTGNENILPKSDGGKGSLQVPTTPDFARSSLQTMAHPEQNNDLVKYEATARKLKLDEQKPPKPDSIIAPVVGNMFGEDDHPTLAGRVISRVYEQLIQRDNFKTPNSREEAIKINELGKQVIQKTADYAKSKLLQRWNSGDQRIVFGNNRQPGTDAFHFDGDANPAKDHVFYFNKASRTWKNANESQVRAYITLSPQQIDALPQHFVDLSLEMYDAGIDFNGKSCSLYGAMRRTDNMVFYISASDQVKASELIKNYMNKNGIGRGYVSAAIPSPQEGLSWAMDPSESQKNTWQKVSGSSEKVSYNAYIATMCMPTYLDRLADAQSKVGDSVSADIYRQEAQRVRLIISGSS